MATAHGRVLISPQRRELPTAWASGLQRRGLPLVCVCICTAWQRVCSKEA